MGWNLYVNEFFDIIVLQSIQMYSKACVWVCACLCMHKQKQCKLRKNQTLCRPNRAAFLPPQSPQWGDETSLILTDYRQAINFWVDSRANPLVCFSERSLASTG